MKIFAILGGLIAIAVLVTKLGPSPEDRQRAEIRARQAAIKVEQQQAALAKAAEDAKRAEELRAGYAQKAPEVLRVARAAFYKGDYVAAKAHIEPWLLVANAETRAVYDQAQKAIKDAETKKQLELEAQQVAAALKIKQREARIGPEPVASAWDGSYYEVQRHLEKFAHDPDSIEMDGCTKPLQKDNGWIVKCDYRGKNAFGALIRKSGIFVIRHGQVVDAADL